MKKNCNRCANLKTCTNEKKENKSNNCSSYKMESMDALKKEYFKLLYSGENKERKDYLEQVLKDFNGGTI